MDDNKTGGKNAAQAHGTELVKSPQCIALTSHRSYTTHSNSEASLQESKAVKSLLTFKKPLDIGSNVFNLKLNSLCNCREGGDSLKSINFPEPSFLLFRKTSLYWIKCSYIVEL